MLWGHWCPDFGAKDMNAFIAFGGTVDISLSLAVGCDQVLQTARLVLVWLR
jgi:hypothetical protein